MAHMIVDAVTGCTVEWIKVQSSAFARIIKVQTQFSFYVL